MSTSAWHLPWNTIEDAPHGLLDLLRGCNISCTSCYNKATENVKSVKEVAEELDTLMRLRRLQSVSLVGGEVTLHPNLCEIVRMVKARGLCVEIFTNGVLLDPPLLEALSQAGTDLIFLHIDGGQVRPDLPHPPSPSALRKLINLKADMVVAHGMDVGLTITAYQEKREDILDAIEIVSQSPHLNYLLVTIRRDLSSIVRIRGNLHSGLWGNYVARPKESRDVLTNKELPEFLKMRLGLRPFACLGSNVDENDPRWISYLIATTHKNGTLDSTLNVTASWCERLFVALSRLITGRYPMYQRQNSARIRLQLLLNALTGGRFFTNMAFLAKACGRKIQLRSKRLLFQCPAFVDQDGRVVHCKNCPDAIVKHGGLVPVCICDYVQDSEGAS